MKTTIISGSCSMFVLGVDMRCPLCKVLVRSGEQHQCAQKPTIKAKPNRRKGTKEKS